MSDELCVNIYDELGQTTGRLANSLFQGLGNMGGNFLGSLMFLIFMVIMVAATVH